MKVVIMRGVAGAGKSTYIENNFHNVKVVSIDQFFMRKGEYKFYPQFLADAQHTCWKEYIEAVQKNEELIIVDNANINVVDLSPYVLPAEVYGYNVEIITLRTDQKLAARRNRHDVSEKVILSQSISLIEQESLFPYYWNHMVIEN